MRVVGKRLVEDIRLREPTDAEIRANIQAAADAPRVIPKGVYRYRSHAEANSDSDRWVVDGVVERNRDLASRS